MYPDAANYFSINNNTTDDNEEMEIIESDEMFSYQTMNSASNLLNSGEYLFIN